MKPGLPDPMTLRAFVITRVRALNRPTTPANRHRRQRSRAAAVVITLGAALRLATGGRAAEPAYRYEVLATLGTQAAGGGALRGEFKVGAVGNAGEVAYVAGVGSGGAQALFLDTPDDVVRVVSPGADAAGGWQFAEKPGLLGGIAAPVAMGPSGDLVFAADLTRAGESGAGVFRWDRSSGVITAIALPGQPGPGGTTLGNARSVPSVAASGAVAFAAGLAAPPSAPDDATGLFLLDAGRLDAVALPGMPAPDGGALLQAGRPSLNNRGLLAFEATQARDNRVTTGIYIAEGAVLRLAVGDGTSLVGGGTLRAAREPRLNDAGDLAFLGDDGESGVYLKGIVGVSRLAAPGMTVPGGARVRAVATGEGSLALNQRGEVAMQFALEQPRAAGIFLSRGGTLTAVALPGTFLAGVGPLDNVGEYLAINDQGQIAFQAELADGEIDLVLATPVPSGG
jgi:hypothetical protein